MCGCSSLGAVKDPSTKLSATKIELPSTVTQPAASAWPACSQEHRPAACLCDQGPNLYSCRCIPIDKQICAGKLYPAAVHLLGNTFCALLSVSLPGDQHPRSVIEARLQHVSMPSKRSLPHSLGGHSVLTISQLSPFCHGMHCTMCSPCTLCLPMRASLACPACLLSPQ